MIFWFSGTGNSKYVAEKIAEANSTGTASIAEIMRGKKFEVNKDEIIGIVFPIYAWAPPKMVVDFIPRLRQSMGKDAYIFAVATCGGTAGYSMRHIEKALGRPLDCAYSIKMPNNYIIGWDVDTKDVEAKALAEAETSIVEINKAVAAGDKGIGKIHIGSMPWLKSIVIAPLFNQFARSTKSFYATDKCNSCGICAKVCPTANVTVKGKPSWGKDCTQCLSCIHHCPTHAIQFGKATEKRGRYVNPNCKIKYEFER